MAFPLETDEPATLGLNPEKLARLCARIEAAHRGA